MLYYGRPYINTQVHTMSTDSRYRVVATSLQTGKEYCIRRLSTHDGAKNFKARANTWKLADTFKLRIRERKQ